MAVATTGLFQVGDPVSIWNEKYQKHFDAKVLAYKEENKTYSIHYINWNRRHDCWVDERFLSFLGGVKTLLANAVVLEYHVPSQLHYNNFDTYGSLC